VFLITHDIEEAVFLATDLILLAPNPGRSSSTCTWTSASATAAGESARAIKSDPRFIETREHVLERVFSQRSAVQRSSAHEQLRSFPRRGETRLTTEWTFPLRRSLSTRWISVLTLFAFAWPSGGLVTATLSDRAAVPAATVRRAAKRLAADDQRLYGFDVLAALGREPERIGLGLGFAF
jgi:hypothetical protein